MVFLCYNNIGEIMKRIIIGLIIIVISIIPLYLFLPRNITKTYNEGIITIKTNKLKEKEIFNDVEQILSKSYKDELYQINHNFNKEEYLTINEELYNIIKYGIELYNESNGLIDISKGNLYDIWNSYINTKVGNPTKQELELSNNQKIDDIILKDNKILNNHINIYIDNILKSIKMSQIKDILDDNHIKDYTINFDDKIIIGNTIETVGLFDIDNNLYETLKISNKAISITNNYQNYYIYDNEIYHNNIDLNTLYPANYIQGVTVIASDIKEANKYSNMLFQMSIEDGKKLIEEKNIDVIWYTNDNEVIETNNVINYK